MGRKTRRESLTRPSVLRTLGREPGSPRLTRYARYAFGAPPGGTEGEGEERRRETNVARMSRVQPLHRSFGHFVPRLLLTSHSIRHLRFHVSCLTVSSSLRLSSTFLRSPHTLSLQLLLRLWPPFPCHSAPQAAATRWRVEWRERST